MIGLRRISEFSSQQSNDSSNLIMITSRSKLLHNPLNLIPQQFPQISPNFQQLTKKKTKNHDEQNLEGSIFAFFVKLIGEVTEHGGRHDSESIRHGNRMKSETNEVKIEIEIELKLI